jgi:hypothetical protein
VTARAHSCAPVAQPNRSQDVTADARQGGGRRARRRYAFRPVSHLRARTCLASAPPWLPGRSLRLLFLVGAVSCIFAAFGPSVALASEPVAESSGFTEEQNVDHFLQYEENDHSFEGLGFSQEEQYSAYRGMAFTEWLDDTYTGARPDGFDGYGAAPESLRNFENTQYTDLVDGFESIPADSAVEAAVGSEAAAVAAGSSLIAPLSLIPIAGLLSYEDITTGSNIVTEALFGSVEDHAVASTVVGAEGIRWKLLETEECLGPSAWFELTHEYTGQVGSCRHRTWELEGFPEDGLETGQRIGSGLSGRGPYIYGEGPVYQLEAEDPPVGGSFKGWWPESSIEIELQHQGPEVCKFGEIEGHCPHPYVGSAECEVIYAAGIAGFPPFKGCERDLESPLKDTEVLVGTSPYISTRGESPHRSEWAGSTVFEVRPMSRQKIGLPKHMTSAEVSALESSSHVVQHSTGKPPNESTLGLVVQNLARELAHKNRNRSLEHDACHFTGCDTKSEPSEGETKFDPPTEAKSEGEPPSIVGLGTVPNCFLVATTGEECAARLAAAGFTSVEVDTRTWETAVITQPADAVITVIPGAGSVVETSSTIVVDQNPDEENFPVFLPTHEPAETGEDYAKRLEREGWTKVSIDELTEPVTGVGPGDVASTAPASTTRIAPGPTALETPVTVDINPAKSPSPGLPPGASFGAPGCGLTPPATSINLGPVTGQKFGSVFPFALLPWLSGTVSGIAASPSEPHFVLHVFGTAVETGNGFAPLATVFTLLRDTIAAFMWLGVAWFLWNRTIGTRMS